MQEQFRRMLLTSLQGGIYDVPVIEGGTGNKLKRNLLPSVLIGEQGFRRLIARFGLPRFFFWVGPHSRYV